MERIKLINDSAAFESAYAGDRPFVLDFYTDNCNPCKTVMRTLEKLAFEYGKDILFLKTKADENIKLAQDLGVMKVPTLIFVDKTKKIERASGLITESALRIKMKQLA
ncbi:MAG: thioredoxin 1 [Crocinitomix sp.]|jgi:thioredoxin 1